MTFLNTVGNFGTKWPSSLSLWLMDRLNIIACRKDGTILNFGCGDEQMCLEKGGQCETVVDAFDVQVYMGLVLGTLYLIYVSGIIDELQSLPVERWRFTTKLKSL